MFAWRKPKPSDDEPLVPHGLIWQATEEPMPAKAERTNPATAQELNSPMMVPMKRDDPPPEHPASTDIPPKMDAVSEPLPWASMNARDAVKRPPPFWDSSSGLKTPPATFVTGADDSKPADSLIATTIPEIKDAANQSTTESFAFKQFVAERNKELRDAWCEFTHVVAEVFANVRHAYANLRLRESVRRTREQAQIRLAQGRASISREAPKIVANQQRPSKMRAEFMAAGSVARRLQTKTAAVFADSRKSARGLMTRRVRVRIAAGPQFRPYIARVQYLRAKSRTILQRDSRLVTSLAMAGLSALLTLGLIVGVGRYQPSASASGPAITSTQQPGVVTIPAHPIAAKPSPTRNAHSAPLTKHAPVVNASLQTPIHPDAPKPPSARHPHHNPDEDYVAPDTYVYYGKKH
jgi:hypothetical protein